MLLAKINSLFKQVSNQLKKAAQPLTEDPLSKGLPNEEMSYQKSEVERRKKIPTEKFMARDVFIHRREDIGKYSPSECMISDELLEVYTKAHPLLDDYYQVVNLKDKASMVALPAYNLLLMMDFLDQSRNFIGSLAHCNKLFEYFLDLQHYKKEAYFKTGIEKGLEDYERRKGKGEMSRKFLPYLLHPEATVEDMQEYASDKLLYSFEAEVVEFLHQFQDLPLTEGEKRIAECYAMAFALQALFDSFTLPEGYKKEIDEKITFHLNQVEKLAEAHR
jgi:hypothetical protein